MHNLGQKREGEDRKNNSKIMAEFLKSLIKTTIP